MKKTILILIAVICFTAAAYAQDLEVRAVARIEANPTYDFDWKEWYTGTPDILGNSSLYTFINGTFLENFSYEVTNYWVNSDPSSLYNQLGTTAYTWLMNANLGYTKDWFGIKLGKITIPTGGIEFLEDDVYIDYPAASMFWNDMTSYQWGGSISVQPWESTAFTLSATSSPYAENIFSKAGFSFLWEGEYGRFTPAWSIGGFGVDGGTNNTFIVASLGNKYSFDSSDLVLDAYISNVHNEAYLSYQYYFGEKFEAMAKVGYSKIIYLDDAISPTAIAAFRYYPIKDSKSLRLHALAGWNQLTGLQLSIGALYDLDFNFDFRH